MPSRDGVDDKARGRSALATKLRVAAVLGLIGGPIVFAIGVFEYLETAKLRAEGITIEGTVVDSSTLNTGRGRTSHRMVVDYKPQGLPTHRKEFLGVLTAVFEQATASGKVPIRYLAQDPTVSAVGDQIVADTERLAIGAGVFIVSLLIWMFVRGKPKTTETAVAAKP